MQSKAQGSLEYLILTAAALAVISIVVLFSTGFFKGQQGSASFGACREAAGVCKLSKYSTPNEPCPQCETACAGMTGPNTGKDLLSGGQGCGAACTLCKLGYSTRINQNYTPHEITPDSSTVGLWHFNEAGGTTAADSSGSENTGTLSGAVWNTSGKFGNALTFDGVNDYVNMPASVSLDVTGAITIEAWVKPSSVVSGGIYSAGYSYATRKGAQFEIRDNAKFRFWIGTNSTMLGDLYSSVLYSPNTWYHLAATWDGNIMKLYVNGLPNTELPNVIGTISYADANRRIGMDSWGALYFNGTIDEVAISNRAKLAWEIWVDANA